MNSVSLGWREEDIAWSIVYLCRRETTAGTSYYSSDNSRRPDARPHARPRSRPRVALALRLWQRAEDGSSWTWGILPELPAGPSGVILITNQSRLATRQRQGHRSQCPNQVTGLPPPHASCVHNTRHRLAIICSPVIRTNIHHPAYRAYLPDLPQTSSTHSSCHRDAIKMLLYQFAAGEYDRLLNAA